MRRTLQEQIRANKRGTVVLVVCLQLVLGTLGGLAVAAYDPDYWLYGAGGALILGLIGVMVSRMAGSKIVLSMLGAREATLHEQRMLVNVVQEMAIAGGIPAPKVYVIDDYAMNAFATGMEPKDGIVAITKGLLEKLDRDELQGVVAHEIAHIRNYDTRLMTMVATTVGIIAILSDIVQMMFRWGAQGSRRRSSNNHSAILFALLAYIFAMLAPILSLLIKMAISRKREYLADATAAEMTRYPEGLARALQKIAHDQDPLEAATASTQHMFIVNPLRLSGGGMSLFSTHPPTDERIKALLGLQGKYALERKLGLSGKPLDS